MINVIRNDIAKVEADIIVNAANPLLMGGGGVDGAIHRHGGPQIMEECQKIISEKGICTAGQAVITTAGNLKAKYVIHTVGPVWKGGNNEEEIILANCYLKSLELAKKFNCYSIAFPSISTGAYRFPKAKAAKVAAETVSKFLKSNSLNVFFVCFEEDDENIIKAALKHLNE